jgi:hypothetical protein
MQTTRRHEHTDRGDPMQKTVVEFLRSSNPQDVPFNTLAAPNMPFIREWRVWFTIWCLLDYLRATGDPRTPRIDALRVVKGLGLEQKVHAVSIPGKAGKTSQRFYGVPVEWLR